MQIVCVRSITVRIELATSIKSHHFVANSCIAAGFLKNQNCRERMMLAFTEQQMDRMATESFLERIISAIAESDPTADAELHAPDGKRIMHEQYEKAHLYGLSTELELGQYIVTAWLLGTDFDTRFPAFQQILAHPTMLPREKAEAIEQTATMLLGMLQAESLR